MDTDLQTRIIEAVLEILIDVAPETATRPMYGGTVFEHEGGNSKTLFGGVFGSKNHVSVEFSNGADFADPDGHLEGKGKKRRHLKLHSTNDIAAKNLKGFIGLASA